MLGEPITQFPQQQEEQEQSPDIIGQISNLLSGAGEVAGDVAKGVGEFAKDNPELIGILGGALLGGTAGFGALGAAGGLMSGAESRQAQEVFKQRKIVAEQAAARKQENVLSKQFAPTKARQTSTRAAQEKIDSSLAQATAAGDLAGIFSFMKVLDPGSVVRESEFRNAEHAKAWVGRMDEEGKQVPTFIRGYIAKLVTGQKLLPTQRKDFIKTSRNVFKAESDKFDFSKLELIKQSQRQKLDSRNVVGEDRKPLKPVEDILALAEKNDPLIPKAPKPTKSGKKIKRRVISLKQLRRNSASRGF